MGCNIGLMKRFLPLLIFFYSNFLLFAQGGGYALDFDGNDGCSDASCSNFVEVSWSTNMSTYTVSVWVKSNSANPAVWRSYFNSLSLLMIL